jgi:lipopolysaccharide transport system ATP-binding protein
VAELALRAESVGKRYVLGPQQAPYQTLRESLSSAARTALDWFARGAQSAADSGRGARDVWALRDVSFDVRHGEVLGVIGRNGAGKSTLLKILSRITEPSCGRATVYGRVGSLLEVGTGFHPELSGRENIYLNGAILGMSRADIRRKFDEIVAFAEVERFLDTPVKRYSSGMYMRLAFSVAAHLEPEILLVDEVLAVGDAAFQKKCLGKMGAVAREGRTILFVSHNMAAVRALCDRAVVLHAGEIAFDGSTAGAISQHLEVQANAALTSLRDRPDRRGTGRIRFVDVWIEDELGNRGDSFTSGQDVCLVAEYVAANDEPLGSLSVAFSMSGPMGEQLTDLWNEGSGAVWENPPPSGRVVCRLPRLPLNAGRYTFNVCGRINTIIADWVLDAFSLSVIAGDYFGTGRLPAPDQGSFLFNQVWSLETTCAA